MKKSYIFIVIQFYFLFSFTENIKAQKIDTVLDIHPYQAYIDTAYSYINYYRHNTFQELMNVDPAMLENNEYFKDKKGQISQMITKYGFPGANNILISKFTLHIANQRQQDATIVINFIFPLANKDEKKDSISIQIICDSSRIRPFSLGINDYRKIEKANADLIKAIDSIGK